MTSLPPDNQLVREPGRQNTASEILSVTLKTRRPPVATSTLFYWQVT
jgi:hypothetical protein